MALSILQATELVAYGWGVKVYVYSFLNNLVFWNLYEINTASQWNNCSLKQIIYMVSMGSWENKVTTEWKKVKN
jgi:hypothetical protein